MMDSMGGDPENRPAFEGERAAEREEVLDPLGGLVAAMREQAVVAHADAQRAGDIPHDDGGEDGASIDEEKRRQRPDVERGHGDGGDPVDALGILAPIERGDGSHRPDNTLTSLPGRQCNTSVQTAGLKTGRYRCGLYPL